MGAHHVSWLVVLLMLGIGFGYAGDSVDRSRESFNRGWCFERFGTMPDGTKKTEPGTAGKAVEQTEGAPGAVSFDDSKWRKLDVPHDWGVEGPFRDELDNNTGKLPWQGIGWYRKHFEVPAGDQGKRVFVDFDGAMANAQVWLNGAYIGTWP